MQIKTTMRHQLTPVRVVIIKETTNNKQWRGCEQREPSSSLGGNVNWWHHCGEQYRGSLKNKIELPYDATILSWVFIWPYRLFFQISLAETFCKKSPGWTYNRLFDLKKKTSWNMASLLWMAFGIIFFTGRHFRPLGRLESLKTNQSRL